MAWGNAGHRVTGLIAESLLTPTAHAQVAQLLDGEGLDVATTFMDTQRGALAKRWPQSDRWHYDNVPVCQQQPYCTDGHCATQQIARFQKILSDGHATHSERALALRLLVHMLGDIHQPLHMADNQDRGGNQLYVRLQAGGEALQLHDVYDTVLVKQLQGKQTLREFARQLRLSHAANLAPWQSGTVTQWAQQTHLLARNHTYAGLPAFTCALPSARQSREQLKQQPITLSDDYLDAARNEVAVQLTKAGARIAFVLNRVLT